jgi:hypothetical protein
MLKVLGSGMALALGAGAVYYWWTHNHGDLEHEFHEMGGEFRDTSRRVKDTLE